MSVVLAVALVLVVWADGASRGEVLDLGGTFPSDQGDDLRVFRDAGAAVAFAQEMNAKKA